MTGRNDPCPCGSGKKFKKCHGTQPPTRATELKAADVELGDRLLRFARTRFGGDWLTEAFALYLDSDADEITQTDAQLAISWALHFKPSTSGGRTVATAFQKVPQQHLSNDARLLLDAYASTWLSIWEVQSVERNVGATLVDLLTREERFVHDVLSSQTLERFDTVLAMVLDVDGVSFFGGVHGQPLPPAAAAEVLRIARRICHVRTRAVPPEQLRDVDIQLDLISMWSNEIEGLRNQPPPSLHNTDGDPFQVTTDDFALNAPRDDIARRLVSMTGVQSPPNESGDALEFAVTKPGNSVNREWDNTLIGRITLSSSHLRVETNSTRRADALRTALEHHLAGMLRFRLRSEGSTTDLMEQALASAQSPGRAPKRDESPPEAVAAMRAYRERYMTAWLDDSIPALGGLTPRQAARSPRDRPALEVLMKQMERSEERLSEAERIDIRRLRVELGLPVSD